MILSSKIRIHLNQLFILLIDAGFQIGSNGLPSGHDLKKSVESRISGWYLNCAIQAGTALILQIELLAI